MGKALSLALRGSAALSASGLMAAGLFFAFQGEDSVEVTSPVEETVSVLVPSEVAESATAAASPEAEATPVPSANTPEAPTSSPAFTAASGRAAVPAATSTPAKAPITDTPKYTDLAVLNLAAAARLPSGRTFRECVELPPSHEKWPTPVHLYYEGNGRWLVETHISEVQVVFDEATATFTARNFQPPSLACLSAP